MACRDGANFNGGSGLQAAPATPTSAELSRSEAAHAAFVGFTKASSEIVVLVGPDLRLTWVSEGARAFGGYEPAALAGRLVADFVHPEDLVRLRESFEWSSPSSAAVTVAAVTGGRSIDLRLLDVDGEYLAAEANVHNLLDDPEVGGYLVVVRELSPRRTYERVLELIAQGATRGEVLAAVLAFVTDATRSPAAAAVVSESGDVLAAIGDVSTALGADAATSGDECGWDGTWWTEPVVAPADGVVIGRLVVRPNTTHGLSASMRAIVRKAADLTALAVERARSEDRLRRAAREDTLTGAANRAWFATQLDQIAGRSIRVPWGLLYVDIDGFKQLNEGRGNRVGDMALVAVAQRLQETVGPDDLVARVGGDEFAVLRPCVRRPSDVELLAQCIVDAFREPLPGNTGVGTVSVSVGVAIADRDSDPDSVIAGGDLALVAAKRAGPGNWRRFSALT